MFSHPETTRLGRLLVLLYASCPGKEKMELVCTWKVSRTEQGCRWGKPRAERRQQSMLNRREFTFFPYWHISFYCKRKGIFFCTLVLCMPSLCNPNEESWEGKKRNLFNSPGCVQTLQLCVHLGHMLATAVTCWWFSRLKHSKMFLRDISLIGNLIFSIMKLKPNYVLFHLIGLKVLVSVLN